MLCPVTTWLRYPQAGAALRAYQCRRVCWVHNQSRQRKIILRVGTNSSAAAEVICIGSADVGLQRKSGDALEGRAFSGKCQRFQGLASVSPGYEKVQSDVEALRSERPDHRASEFPYWNGVESITQWLSAYFL